MTTGIAPHVWADEGLRAMATAIEIIEKRNPRSQQGDEGEPQMSG